MYTTSATPSFFLSFLSIHPFPTFSPFVIVIVVIYSKQRGYPAEAYILAFFFLPPPMRVVCIPIGRRKEKKRKEKQSKGGNDVSGKKRGCVKRVFPMMMKKNITSNWREKRE